MEILCLDSLLLLLRVRVLVPGCLLLRDQALVQRRHQGIALQVRTDDNQLLTAVKEQGAALLIRKKSFFF